jgi:hypothetical protein
MYKEDVFVWSRRVLFGSFLLGVSFAVMQLSAFAAGSVTLAWDPSTDPVVTGYNVYYGGASGTYTNKICAGNATNATISSLVQGTTYYFAATTYAASGIESSFSSELSYLVPPNVPIVNQPPTLNAISNLTTNENAGLQTVSLSGITSGAANENQVLHVTAVSSNLTLIPNPTVNYTSANTTGTLTFTPVANASGTALITVTVNDGGTSNSVVTRTFMVTVNAVNTSSTNSSPTLDPVNNLVLNAGDGLQRIILTGISSGTTNKTRRLRVTARASNHLISRLMVQYISPGTNGTLIFRPGRSTGTAAISVTVNNGEKRNNIITRTFTVTLVPPGASTSSAATTNALANDKGSGDPAFAAVLTPLAPASGRFAMTVAGVHGDKYVVEASTDLVHWVPVQTNTAPFTFVDAQAGQISRQFYRSVYLP